MDINFSEAWTKMVEKLESWLDMMVIGLPNFLIALVVFILTIIISKHISNLTLKLLGRSKLQHSMKNLIAKIVRRIR